MASTAAGRPSPTGFGATNSGRAGGIAAVGGARVPSGNLGAPGPTAAAAAPAGAAAPGSAGGAAPR
jgi:hypothetical protein